MPDDDDGDGDGMAIYRVCVCEKSVAVKKDGTPRHHACGADGGPRWAFDPAQVTEHVHTYMDVDDGNGHSGSYCACGKEEPVTEELPEDKVADVTPDPVINTALANWNGTGRPQPTYANTKPDAVESVGTVLGTGPVTQDSVNAFLAAQEPADAFVSPTVSATPAQSDVDAFLSPTQAIPLGPVNGQPPTERDRYGRYVAKDPRTGQYLPSRGGKRQGFTRTTTVIDLLSNKNGVFEWEKRHVVKGMAENPDLVERAKGLDVRGDKTALGKIVYEAKVASGGDAASELGTRFHTVTEHLDAGTLHPRDVPEDLRPMAEVYLQRMAEAGLATRPEWIERVVYTDVLGFPVAGKPDRILVERNGNHVIGDVKTGSTMEYGESKMAMQLLTYALAVNQYGLWDANTETWFPWTGPPVSEEYGVIMHVPSRRDDGRSPYCDLYRIDFGEVMGYQVIQALRAAVWLRGWQKAKGFAKPYTPPLPAAAAAPGTWEAAFDRVRTRSEANALWQRAKDAHVPEAELDYYVTRTLARNLPEYLDPICHID